MAKSRAIAARSGLCNLAIATVSEMETCSDDCANAREPIATGSERGRLGNRGRVAAVSAAISSECARTRFAIDGTRLRTLSQCDALWGRAILCDVGTMAAPK